MHRQQQPQRTTRTETDNTSRRTTERMLLECITDYSHTTRMFILHPEMNAQFTQYLGSMQTLINLLKERIQPAPLSTELFTFEIPLPTRTTPAFVPLTATQIAENTRNIVYDVSMNEVSCPITMEAFAVGENICQINSCRHIFKTEALMRWLRNHSVCPMCRQNVSPTAAAAAAPASTTPTTDNILGSEFMQNLIRNILNPNDSFNMDINDISGVD